MKNWYQHKVLPRLLNLAMSSPKLEKIRLLVVAKASGVVLEIGAGAGHNIPLYKNSSKLYVLEPSEELLAIAKTRPAAMPIEFLSGGAEYISLPDQSIDTVVSTWTLCSVADPEKVLLELVRVLRPGGNFLFVDHGISPNFLTRSMQRILTPLIRHIAGNCHLDRDIEKIITRAGFAISYLEHPRWPLKPLIYNYKGIASVN